MTLMNGLIEGDRAHLWSDTLYVNADTGEAIGQGAKAFTCSLFPGAAAMTTIGGNPGQIVEYAAARPSLYFGHFLETLEAAARAFVANGPSFATVRLLVAGWCYETDRPRLFLIASDGATTPQAYVPHELAWCIGSAFTLPAVQERIQAGLTIEAMEEIADLQRANPEKPDLGGFSPMMGIGGELLRLTVTREGVETATVKAWDVAEAA